MNVVMVIPSQGKDTNSFEDSARRLKKVLYPRAVIVRTTITVGADKSISVVFSTSDGHPFAWGSTLALSRVFTISHAFSGDGPNLNYGSGGDNQPWGSSPDDPEKLSDVAATFWRSVGDSLRSDGKIILLGCFMGAGAYAGNVAKITGKKVYASTSLFGAGNADSALKYVRVIEKGKSMGPMKEFGGE